MISYGTRGVSVASLINFLEFRMKESETSVLCVVAYNRKEKKTEIVFIVRQV